ncbi:golgi apparatus protein 1 [Caerostris extrusa]|uniref:Golgi apparatus protein 1 n=1 Tax=Caerostris extrusa TaxID=172846 RepID=A0AAV4VLX7_CAEEX|nr:golgi apparatus protein 1 [Caerostris extrusa]
MFYITIFALFTSTFCLNPSNIKDAVNKEVKIASFGQKPRFKMTTSSPPRIKLSDTPECADDIRHLCPTSILNNNFAVLDCLQNDKQREDADLSAQCHHLVWTFKRNLTIDNRFVTTAKHMCKKIFRKSKGLCSFRE